MKVILAGTYPAGTAEKFKELLPQAEFITAQTQSEYDALTEGDCIVVRVLKTPAATMRNKKDLKAVIRWGAGYDSVDTQAAGQMHIMVANTPGVNSYAVSELAVALMLAVGRKLICQNAKTHGGVWNNKLYSDEMTTLNHKTVGIIGGGNIGRRVAMQVQSFGAETVYYDVFRLSPETEAACRMKYVPLGELLRSSDVITLHVPLLDSTRHMIGKEEFDSMKDHAVIINTARGGLIDDEALLSALDSGKIAGAGLDCVENENLPENPLSKRDDVVMTPHMGGTSNDLADEMVPEIAKQIRLLEETGSVGHIVNQEYL